MTYVIEFCLRLLIFYLGFLGCKALLNVFDLRTCLLNRFEDPFRAKLLMMFAVIICGQVIVLLTGTALSFYHTTLNIVELVSISLALSILFYPSEESHESSIL